MKLYIEHGSDNKYENVIIKSSEKKFLGIDYGAYLMYTSIVFDVLGVLRKENKIKNVRTQRQYEELLGKIFKRWGMDILNRTHPDSED